MEVISSLLDQPPPCGVSLDDLPHVYEPDATTTAVFWLAYRDRCIADCYAIIDEASQLTGRDRRIMASRAATLFETIVAGGKPQDGTGRAWLRLIRGVERAFAAIGYTQWWRLRDDPWDADRPAPAPPEPEPACDQCGGLLRRRSPMLDTIYDGAGHLVAIFTPVWSCCPTCRTITEGAKLIDTRKHGGKAAKRSQVVAQMRTWMRVAQKGSFDDHVIGRRPRAPA